MDSAAIAASAHRVVFKIRFSASVWKFGTRYGREFDGRSAGKDTAEFKLNRINARIAGNSEAITSARELRSPECSYRNQSLQGRLVVFLNANSDALWSFPMLAEGVWAEVKIAGEHLRLFSEHSPLGVQSSVYNVTAKNWIAPSEPVDDIEQGKERAAAHAQAYLKKTANVELPRLEWKKSRSA